MNYRALAGLLAAAVMMAGAAQAAPVALNQGDFGPGDVLVDFNAVGNEAVVGGAYSGLGVTFSGDLYGMTNSGDTAFFPGNGGGVIASNWKYGGGGLQGLSFTAQFDNVQTRVGFFIENWSNQTASVELFNGAASLGVLNLANTSDLAAEFRGIGDAGGFDRLVFTNTADQNGFFAIDDFRFGNGRIGGGVPEPATWALMIGGFGLAGSALRRRRALAA